MIENILQNEMFYLRFFGAGAAITEATTAKNKALTISNDFAIFVWLEIFDFLKEKEKIPN